MQTFMEKYQNVIIRLVVIIGVLLSLLLIVLVTGQVKSLKYIGSGLPASNTITVSGHGEVDKAPDTAKFSFTIQDEEKDTASAQAIVSKKVDAVKSDLIAAGIDTQYITTDSYNSYPDYQYTNAPVCVQGPCASGTQTLKGYIVSQNVNVSVKDLSKTETVAGILGKDGVTSISGPNLGFEDPHEVSNEARAQAITDAQAQAKVLAQSLGVSLVRIVGFNDNSSNGSPMPIYKAMNATAAAAPATPPSIPTGVQTVTSDVSITYEIK
jgi:uncharacterized protein YggE